MKKKSRVDILSKVDSFPSMPGAAVKMLSLLDNPETTVSQIEDILRYEPGLTANILKLTNSAYFGLPSKVGSVRHAVVLLGWRRLVQLVMASCVSAIMNKSVPGYDLPPGGLWRHSIAVSVASEGLIKELGLPSDDEVFTAALLHDLGKLILGNSIKDDIRTIEVAASEGVPFEVAEYMVLGTDHAEVGAKILESWSFPPKIVNAVRWHHEPDSAEESDIMLDIVHVANVLCLMIGVGVGREGLRYEPSRLSTKRLGLKTSHLEKVASRTIQWVNELTDVFGAQ